MKIIEEMRAWASDLRYDGWETTPATINKWADHLEISGALVPVPDGEACQIQQLESDLFLHNGTTYRIPEGEFYGIPIGYKGPHYAAFYGDAQSIVQPVRLVPITEAQIDE